MAGIVRHRVARPLAAALAGLAVSLLLLAGLARPAGAQTYGPQPLGITCTVSIGLNGISIACTASGFRPGATVAFTIYSAPTSLGTAVADGNGRASINAGLTSVLAAGEHRVEAVGLVAPGNQGTVSTMVTLPGSAGDTNSVAGTDTSRALPRTGFDVTVLASAGSALVAAGGLIVLTARRRRRQADALAGS